MKPRTKLQVQVYNLSQELPNLREDQKQWAFKHCLQHKAFRTKKSISCLDCGYVWAGSQIVKSCTCPQCGVKLKIEDTRKKKYDQSSFLGVIDVREGFQITRFFKIDSYHKAGEPRRTYSCEVVQLWIIPNEKFQIIARNRMYNWSTNSFHGDMEIRDKSTIYHKYNLYVDKVLPEGKCLPIYKRNGFRNFFGDITPYDMFTKILTDAKSETLLKTKQFSLLEASVNSNRRGSVYRYWNSIKICIRNSYFVKDAGMWLDYLDLLHYFGKDLRSPKYVCPSNLKQVHDKLVAKKREFQRLEEVERNKKEAELRKKRAVIEQKDYAEAKGLFFGLKFLHKNLTIKVLESVQEFIQEGDIHKHCVFTNEYYKKEDSLCFSALIDGVSVETIEVSISKLKILQSRGLRNNASEYHDQIVELMNKNMSAIKKRQKGQDKIAA